MFIQLYKEIPLALDLASEYAQQVLTHRNIVVSVCVRACVRMRACACALRVDTLVLFIVMAPKDSIESHIVHTR